MPFVQIANGGKDCTGGKRGPGINNGRFLVFPFFGISPIAGCLIAAFQGSKVETAVRHVQGPEDTIARGKCLFSIVYARYINFEVACHIIKPEKLAQLMYKAAMNDVKMKERPEFNLWADITFDLDGFEQIMALKLLALIGPGMFAPAIHRRPLRV